MSNPKRTALATYRRRMKRQGVVRVEVNVLKEDTQLIRSVAKALGDPDRAEEARALLREQFTASKPVGLKALLAEAPLEGIDLTRDADLGRDVQL